MPRSAVGCAVFGSLTRHVVLSSDSYSSDSKAGLAWEPWARWRVADAEGEEGEKRAERTGSEATLPPASFEDATFELEEKHINYSNFISGANCFLFSFLLPAR